MYNNHSDLTVEAKVIFFTSECQQFKTHNFYVHKDMYNTVKFRSYMRHSVVLLVIAKSD